MRFLQWALPRLQMRWPGFRKVRKQVCKRLDRRIRELGLGGAEEYRSWLEEHSDEWTHLDSLCRITISRFYRDRAVFDVLARQVLPTLADAARRRGENVLQIWSAGCGSGEEPYTLALTWRLALQHQFPGMDIDVVATDVDPRLLRRARSGRYPSGCLRELPEAWRDQAFQRDGDNHCLARQYRQGVRFMAQDIRSDRPEGCFDLVLCRNLAFTYFDTELQREILKRIVSVMRDGAALVIGSHENLPDTANGLSAWIGKRRIYRKSVRLS